MPQSVESRISRQY